MSEKKPEPEIKSEDIRLFFRRHRITRYVAEVALHSLIKLHAFSVHGPEGLKMVQDPERLAGMTEGSIIGSRLAYPDKRVGDLVYKHAPAGQWLGYDFRRPAEFPVAAKNPRFSQEKQGVLWNFWPEEIRDNDSDTQTPLNYLHAFSLDHMLTLDKSKLEDLVDNGVLARTTHAEAYERVGQTALIAGLRARNVDTELTYQVTPKGNTLVHLTPESGDTTPKKDPQFEFAKLPGLIAH